MSDVAYELLFSAANMLPVCVYAYFQPSSYHRHTLLVDNRERRGQEMAETKEKQGEVVQVVTEIAYVSQCVSDWVP